MTTTTRRGTVSETRLHRPAQNRPKYALNWDNRGTSEERPRQVLEHPRGMAYLKEQADMTERTCSVNGCEKPARTRGWCNAHYLKWYRHGDPEHRPGPREIPECAVEGCERPAKSRGWCNAHYLRWWQNSDLGKAVIRLRGKGQGQCKFPGCGRPSPLQGLCDAHQRQRSQGKTLTILQKRTNPLERDEHGRKLCGTCDTWLLVENFTRSVSRSDGLAARCKRCERSSSLKRKFGVTLAEYEDILTAQGGGCAICGKTEAANRRRLAVDHDHACCPGQRTCGNCLRGLLCSSCNLHLGAVGDNIAHIEAMANYLRTASPSVMRGNR